MPALPDRAGHLHAPHHFSAPSHACLVLLSFTPPHPAALHCSTPALPCQASPRCSLMNFATPYHACLALPHPTRIDHALLRFACLTSPSHSRHLPTIPLQARHCLRGLTTTQPPQLSQAAEWTSPRKSPIPAR